MEAEKPFEQGEYWIERHRKLKGDPRSVGNCGRSVEENTEGENAFKRYVGVAAELLRPSCRSVLDLGCGYGRVASEFIERGFHYTGIDVSPDAIEQGRRDNPEGNFLVMDLNDWEVTGKFDAVCVFYVFVHFVDDSKWSTFFDRALSSVASNGYLVFADQFPAERNTAGAHVVARPLSSYTPRLLEQGFQYDSEMKAAFVEVTKTKAAEQFQFARRIARTQTPST